MYDLGEIKRRSFQELLKKFNSTTTGGALSGRFKEFYRENKLCDKFLERRFVISPMRFSEQLILIAMMMVLFTVWNTFEWLYATSTVMMMRMITTNV